MLKILPYLKLAVERNASDLYLTPDAPAMLRIEGEMAAVGKSRLTAEFIRDMVYSILTPEQQVHLDQHWEIDLATEAGGLGRFRVNAFRQRGTISMVMRYIKAEVPQLDALRMPEILKSLAMLKRGLILMVGPTGCGKSTTLAAMIRHRNESAAGHILSIEDPIEYVHRNHRSIVSQREVGHDTVSYERAMISAVREAPDVVFIGEVRQRSTMEACIQIANTGHLLMSTLHANNAAQALQRVVNLYPGEMRDQLYLDLSLSLRAIISQRLALGKDGKRHAAMEVMINTPYIADLILARRISEIGEAMEQSSDRGMQTFDQALYALYEKGEIDMETALSQADSRANLEARINFGR